MTQIGSDTVRDLAHDRPTHLFQDGNHGGVSPSHFFDILLLPVYALRHRDRIRRVACVVNGESVDVVIQRLIQLGVMHKLRILE